jgi:hypothetical protein
VAEIYERNLKAKNYLENYSVGYKEMMNPLDEIWLGWGDVIIDCIIMDMIIKCIIRNKKENKKIIIIIHQ